MKPRKLTRTVAKATRGDETRDRLTVRVCEDTPHAAPAGTPAANPPVRQPRKPRRGGTKRKTPP